MPGQLHADLPIRQAVPIPTATKTPSPPTTTVTSPNLTTTTATHHPPPNSKSVAIAINSRHSPAAHAHQNRSPADATTADAHQQQQRRNHKHKLSSYTEASPLVAGLSSSSSNGGGGATGGGGGGGLLSAQSRNNSLTFRPAKRQMATPDQTIAVINASGRQAASLIRYATAVGFRVRAQLRNTHGVIAQEVCTNPSVTVLVGELYTRDASSSSSASGATPLSSPTTSPPPAPGAATTTTMTASRSSHSNSNSNNVDVSSQGPISGIGVNRPLIAELFRGCQLAFINTTFYGDEDEIGRALADEAARAGISHYVYSSMPDHAAYDPSWPSLPLYSSKHRVEEYIRSKAGLQATFVYAGIYNNNFTSLPYPLFCMELQPDGSFVWQAPFHPDAKLPWLDCEHDFGTAILTIFKEGPRRWGGGRRVPIAFEMLTPREACRSFARGVGRPVRYVRGPIEVKVKIPEGYRVQLDMVERLYSIGRDDPRGQPLYFGDPELEAGCPAQAMELWGGHRTLEQYAREEFIIEEHANGLRWMLEEDVKGHGGAAAAGAGGNGVGQQPQQQEDGGREVTQPVDDEEREDDEEDDDEEEDGLVMSGPKRLEEKWLA